MRHPRQASPCGDAASRQSHESITQGSPVASVVSLVEMHYAGGNDLSRLVDFGAATVATPGVCGSGELSGAASEHCRQNRKRKSAADWNGNWSRQEVKRRHVLSGRRTKTLRGYWMAVGEFLEDGLAPFKKVCEPTLRPTLPRIRRRHRHQHLVEATLVRAKAPSVKILMLKRDG